MLTPKNQVILLLLGNEIENLFINNRHKKPNMVKPPCIIILYCTFPSPQLMGSLGYIDIVV